MRNEQPTLKIRVALYDNAIAGGDDCRTVAGRMLQGSPEAVEILDAKWGRKPSEWGETRGWGRDERLTDRQAGYIAGCASYVEENTTARALLDIIDSLTAGNR